MRPPASCLSLIIRKTAPMKRLPQVLMAASGLLLLTLFVWPMWSITLLAPQYPQGVKMFIYINKIGGDTPSSLQNINILNHYVGMEFIEPESIPELTYFPYIVVGMAVLAFVFAFIGNKKLFLLWALLMTLLALVGIYDFYLWEYHYGHNLNPHAPIQIPGASYQPPLLGTKVILNFTAISLPAVGGYLAGAAIFLSYLAWWLKKKVKG